MSSSELLNIKERNTSLPSDVIKCKEIVDVKKTSQHMFKTKETYFKEFISLTSSSTSLGSEHQFSISRSDGFVGSFFLEFLPDNNDVFDVGKIWAYSAIDYIQVEIGKKILRYSGLSLLQFLCTVNNNDTSTKTLLGLIGGNEGADINSTIGICVLLAPGSNGVIKGLTNMSLNPLWPIGKCSNDMVIKVGLKSSADIDVNAKLALTHLKLHYYRYKIKGDPSILKKGTGKNVIYTWNFVDIVDNSWKRTQTSGTVDSVNISSIIQSGELQFISLYQVTDANHDDNKEYFESQEITALSLKIKGNTKLYEHSSTNEAILKMAFNWKQKTIFPNTSTYFYNIPISSNFAWDPVNLGSKGCDLNLETPVLDITGPASDTIYLKVMSVYKCLYNVKSNGIVEQKLQF